MITGKILKEEISKYNLHLIREFIRLFMPPPIAKYKYIKVKTSDNISISLWGETLQSIWDSFQSFIRIQIFI